MSNQIGGGFLNDSLKSVWRFILRVFVLSMIPPLVLFLFDLAPSFNRIKAMGLFFGSATVIISLTTLFEKGLKKQIEKLRAQVTTTIRRTRKPLFVSELYALEVKHRAWLASAILLLCLVIAVLVKDYVAAGIVVAIIAAIFGFSSLTKTRAEGGWFGDNPYEVLELLHFIIAKRKSGGLPPGARISRTAPELIPADAPSEEAARGRA